MATDLAYKHLGLDAAEIEKICCSIQGGIFLN